MSTALRIAAVTQVLKDLLNDGLINNDVSGITQNNITVSSLSPDRIAIDNGAEASQLNIFMYQATYNQGWRNVTYPSFNAKGERIANPPLALDLHYLLTAYGASELHTDILLGMGMQFLHETPVLERELIAEATGSAQVNNPGNSLPDSLRFLSQALLADQAEQVTISPEALSIEDISKLWAAFGTKYRPTAAYKVTVVLIESEKHTSPGLPVKERSIYIQPFKLPFIEKILSQSAPAQPAVEGQKILSGYRLTIKGNNLFNDAVEINIDGTAVDAAASNQQVSPAEISFTLPGDLSAGAHELKIVHPLLMGTPPVPHKGAGSKPVLFTLSPHIEGNILVIDRTVSNGLVSAIIHATVQPAVQPGQRVQLLLNEMAVSGAAQAYTFTMPASAFGEPAQAISSIPFEISGVKAGNYLVRIVTDGAESPLQTNVNHQYISPAVSI